MIRLYIKFCALISIMFLFVFANGIAKADTSGNATGFKSKLEPTYSQLATTTWQLVKIITMDGSIYQPEEQTNYTLKLNLDGTLAMQADCNRGTGMWYSKDPGHMLFEKMASTRAQCGQNSLSEKYLAQLAWVRSYIIDKGNLYLGTMADGSMMEFRPMTFPAAATVLGEEIHTNSGEELQQEIISRLFDQYALANNLKATEEEIDEYIDRMKQHIADDPNLAAMDDLTAEEAAQVQAMRREMANALISQWKLNRALYQQYGGRVIFQQLGPEPIDAYRQYLEERHAAGDFSINENVYKDKFWRYFTDETIHSFYPSGSEGAAKAFVEPPWSGKVDKD